MTVSVVDCDTNVYGLSIQDIHKYVDQRVAKTLNDSQKQKLYEFLLEHSDVFATKESDLGRTTRLTHSIHTCDKAPI